MGSPTEQLAEFVTGIDADSLPEPVRLLVIQHTADTFAGMFASAAIPEATSVLKLLGNSNAEIAGKAAMLAHAAESDPIHAATTMCAGLVAVPPALLFSPNGATAIAAMVAGYETAIRIGQALGSARLLGQGWWPTAVLGGAGAAAATARALRLTAEQTRNAISLALIQAGGLGMGAPEAPQSRNLLAAHCVRTGVGAAEAAAAGIQGPAEPLVGERGFLSAFGVEPSPDLLLEGLGQEWKIAETCLKAFPCALQAQSALDALQDVTKSAGLSATDILSVEFSLPAPMSRIVDRPAPPASRFAAAASLQFLAAAFLLDGDIDPARMEAGARAQEDIVALMDKISVTHAPDLDQLYPTVWPARVRLVTAGGDHTAEIHIPAGHPERPLPLKTTLDRFRAYSAGRLDVAAQEAMIDAVTGLADLTDLSEITTPIRALL
ncbi:MAG: MmgE/PrpD family protein [Proteobacteria bacterium]|nr:MmgE/PrpD family protein [Pseudomonadota bacterium]